MKSRSEYSNKGQQRIQEFNEDEEYDSDVEEVDYGYGDYRPTKPKKKVESKQNSPQ